MRTMHTDEPAPVLTAQVERLAVRVYPDRAAMGAASGGDVAAAMRALLSQQARVRMIFAAAPSQREMLATLADAPGVDWSRVDAMHMDEYLDLPRDAPARFGAFLRGHLFDRVHPGTVAYLAADTIASDDETAIAAECDRYTELLDAAPIDIVCLGVGENGHIAFNDPPVADFHDPARVKPVTLDAACRQQQVNDGCFPDLHAVPRRALTLTVPALCSGARLFCTVPGPTKRDAVQYMPDRTGRNGVPGLGIAHAPRVYALR